MNALFTKIGHEMYERVWVAKKSTILGLFLSAAIIGVDEFTTYLQALPKGWAPVAATAVALVGASLRKKAIEVAGPMLALIAAASLFAGGVARAEDPQPSALGGTFRVGNVQAAYGPRLLPGMLALNFRTGDVAVVSIGGLAYGCDFFADKPYSIGVAGFLGAQVGKDAVPSSISTGVVATLFHYAVVGWHHGVTGGVKTDNFVAGPSVAF